MSERNKIRGKVWVFGDILDVDFDIYPIENLRENPRTEEDYGKYCMTNIDPDFPKKVNKGDFIVAGKNMGYGHDHESAPMSIKGCGLAAVICESTNRNFLRNSIHIGLPVIECQGIKDIVKGGDEITVDLRSGMIDNISTGKTISFPPYPDFMMEIIDAGGLYPLIRHKLAEGDVPIYARV
jgi:3-isopropylmalate/(R)-2-methylmalate dehydratase small subunit